MSYQEDFIAFFNMKLNHLQLLYGLELRQVASGPAHHIWSCFRHILDYHDGRWHIIEKRLEVMSQDYARMAHKQMVACITRLQTKLTVHPEIINGRVAWVQDGYSYVIKLSAEPHITPQGVLTARIVTHPFINGKRVGLDRFNQKVRSNLL